MSRRLSRDGQIWTGILAKWQEEREMNVVGPEIKNVMRRPDGTIITCGLCARFGTNMMSEPMMHSLGCPKEEK